MTLRRLTALEIGKVEEESRVLKQRIAELKELLGSEQAIRETVAREAREVADALGNPRRTKVEFNALCCLTWTVACNYACEILQILQSMHWIGTRNFLHAILPF